MSVVCAVLEEDSPVMNWSHDVIRNYGSRLYPLWNRTSGDCLLDSVLQATWGVFDREGALRSALYDCLSEGATLFHARWREWETLQASAMNYSVLDYQWQQDWDNLVTRASQPGRALEQMHVFVLAHIFRRPIIVYGVKYVKSFRGETLDLAKFQGIYLPLLWEHSFCYKSPIALGYTRGHFSALVCIDGGYSDNAAAEASNIESNYSSSQIHFLPLVDHEGSLLPVHFLTRSEVSCSLMS
jgi:ubiquitin thioesterase ZRANB1